MFEPIRSEYNFSASRSLKILMLVFWMMMQIYQDKIYSCKLVCLGRFGVKTFRHSVGLPVTHTQDVAACFCLGKAKIGK